MDNLLKSHKKVEKMKTKKSESMLKKWWSNKITIKKKKCLKTKKDNTINVRMVKEVN